MQYLLGYFGGKVGVALPNELQRVQNVGGWGVFGKEAPEVCVDDLGDGKLCGLMKAAYQQCLGMLGLPPPCLGLFCGAKVGEVENEQVGMGDNGRCAQLVLGGSGNRFLYPVLKRLIGQNLYQNCFFHVDSVLS